MIIIQLANNDLSFSRLKSTHTYTIHVMYYRNKQDMEKLCQRIKSNMYTTVANTHELVTDLG